MYTHNTYTRVYIIIIIVRVAARKRQKKKLHIIIILYAQQSFAKTHTLSSAERRARVLNIIIGVSL